MEIMNHTDLAPIDLLVNFDVVLLLTQVSIAKTVTIIEDKCPIASDITDLLKRCITNIYLVYNKQIYKQAEGRVHQLSPAIANLFM